MSVRTNPEVHFPDVRVTLVGTDGDAFAVLGKVRRALSAGGATQAQVEELSSDYDHLLATCMDWVDVS